MNVFKIFIVAAVCAIIALTIKQVRPEYAQFVELAGTAVILAFVITYIKRIISSMDEITTGAIINKDYMNMLTKSLGIAIMAKICADVCRDSGNNVLATDVELGAKFIIIAFCVPMIKAIVSLAAGLIDV